MSEKVIIASVVLFFLSMLAMCGMCLCVNMGVCNREDLWVQLTLASPAIVIALSLCVVEIAQQINKKRKNKQ